MKYIKWLFIALIALALIVTASIFILSEKEPEGYTGSEADELAKNVLTALNYDAWQELRYIQFTFFRGEHRYRWDKEQNVAEITWDGNKVIMNLDTKEALCFKNSAPVTELVYKNALINEAWKYWCNDSFWMFAPYKLFDPGTVRSIVKTQNSNTTGLKIEYTTGGYTPGDSYVWEINENNIPVSWKIWASNFPIKGLETTWEKWVKLPGGSMVSTFHSNSVLDMEMKDIQASNSLAELGWSDSTFNYQ